MAKSDIKSAFHLLPVHPNEINLLGFSINRNLFYDKCMPMGCSISFVTFKHFSTSLKYCARRVAGTRNILHYLDDFLFVGRLDSLECVRVLCSFGIVCKDFGVPIAQDKTEGPTTGITFLSMVIDIINQQIQVPQSKIVSVLAKLGYALSKHKLTLKELQSLLGSVNFVCKAVRPGRAVICTILLVAFKNRIIVSVFPHVRGPTSL